MTEIFLILINWDNCNYILFGKLPRPGDSEETFRSSSQAVTCPRVYHFCFFSAFLLSLNFCLVKCDSCFVSRSTIVFHVFCLRGSGNSILGLETFKLFSFTGNFFEKTGWTQIETVTQNNFKHRYLHAHAALLISTLGSSWKQNRLRHCHSQVLLAELGLFVKTDPIGTHCEEFDLKDAKAKSLVIICS